MKTTIIIDEALPNGLAANTAAVLGISLGKAHPEMVGESAFDSEGHEYAGITRFVVPILSADQAKLKEIAQSARPDEELRLIPFTGVAQKSRDYESYKKELSRTGTDELTYSGIALTGPKKKVSGLTGALPLLK